jgi:hypothetical protein
MKLHAYAFQCTSNSYDLQHDTSSVLNSPLHAMSEWNSYPWRRNRPPLHLTSKSVQWISFKFAVSYVIRTFFKPKTQWLLYIPPSLTLQKFHFLTKVHLDAFSCMPATYLQFSFLPRKQDYVTNNARAGDYVTANTRAGHYYPKRRITNTFTSVDSWLFVRTLNRILQNGSQRLLRAWTVPVDLHIGWRRGDAFDLHSEAVLTNTRLDTSEVTNCCDRHFLWLCSVPSSHCGLSYWTLRFTQCLDTSKHKDKDGNTLCFAHVLNVFENNAPAFSWDTSRLLKGVNTGISL